MLIFRTVEGHDIAIAEDAIAMVWASLKHDSHSVIEFGGERDGVTVDCEFNELMRDGFERVDLRPKAEPIPIRKKK